MPHARFSHLSASGAGPAGRGALRSKEGGGRLVDVSA